MVAAKKTIVKSAKLDQQESAARVLNGAIRWMAPLFLFGLAGSFIPARSYDGLWPFGVQVAAGLLMIALAFSSIRLSALLRMTIYCGCTLAYGFAGLVQWGLAGNGLAVVILAMVFVSVFGFRYWLILVSLAVSCMVGVAAAWVYGWLPLKFDPVLLMRSPAAWFLAIGTLLVAGVAALIWDGLYRELWTTTQQLQESEQNYREIFNATSDALIIQDESGRMLDVNERMCAMFGYDRETVLGLSINDISRGVSPYSQAEADEWVRRTISEGPQTFEWQSKRAHGALFWAEVALHASEIAGQQRVIASIRDITERKRAEELLRESEERNRVISEMTTDYLVIVGIDETGKPQLRWISDSYTSQTGNSPEQARPSDLWQNFIHPEDRARFAAFLAQAIERGEQGEMECRSIARSKGESWIQLFSKPQRRVDGRVGSILGAVKDITERKQAEAEREALIQELESRNAELERFTYTVSHDLKSPLVTIAGFVGFLEKDARAGNWERLQADVAHITEAATQMGRMLDELLELSRIGRLMNPPEPIPFALIVSQALELVHGRLAAGGVTVKVAAELPVVYGDPGRLVEVVQNLVDNAAKFMGEQAHPCIEIGVHQQNGEPLFFVRDNGIGIEPQYQQKVFGLFNKLDEHSEGTGIGLTLVQRIVEVHGGRIWVESEGPGATFYFTLPGAPPPSTRRRSAASAYPDDLPD